MLPKTGLVAVAALVVLIPVTSASPNIWGTEENPELADPPGNVDYSPLHTGGERRYIDLLAGWFEYDAVNDNLNFTLKVSSLDGVNESTEDGWFVRYEFRGNVSNGADDTGQLQYWVQRSHATGTWMRGVDLETPSGDVEVPFTFERVDGTPGYFRWYVPMGYLQNWGEQVATFAASASEERYVLTYATTGVLNRNVAQAEGAFIWKDLEPTPVTETDDEFLTPRSGEPTPTTAAESVAVGLAASAAAVLVAVAWRRRI